MMALGVQLFVFKLDVLQRSISNRSSSLIRLWNNDNLPHEECW